MENNEHFCIRHPFNSIKNWWFNKRLNEIDPGEVFFLILIVVLVGWCCWVCTQDNNTFGCTDSTCKITISETPTSKCFSETIYISE